MGILFRSIFLDLCKVLLVTASVLVTVIAFGAAIKPLSENMIGPADILRVMAYTTVPMLQFALPFAGAFAAVIVFHRLVNDNEILAMAASGMPYRRIMRPVFALGIVLTAVMVFLVDYGGPTFWRELKQLVAKDLTRVFVAYVERGEARQLGGTEIYADEAYVQEAPPDSGATQRLRLVGVAAIEFNHEAKAEREPQREFTAQYATVDVHRVGVNSLLKIALQNASVYNRGDRAIAGAAIVRPEAIDLGRTVDQGPKGLTFLELMELRKHLERDPDIDARRRELALGLAAADAWQALADAVAAKGPVVFETGSESDSDRFELDAAALDGATAVGRDGKGIVIRQRSADGRVRSEISADHAALSLASIDADGDVRFDLLADDALVRDVRAPEAATIRRPVRLTDLELAPETAPRVDRETASIDELRAAATARMAAAVGGPADAIKARLSYGVRELDARVKYTSDEIVARIVQRIAQSMTAMIMLVAATVFTLWFRNRSPLFIYVVAFVPAIIDILLVSGGEQMLRRNVSVSGIVVAFSGNALLLVLSLIGAWRVGRH
ncbi:MAG: LptF/LptG family permease [Phycisphaerales bacterium]